MKFNCDKRQQKERAQRAWHAWFAWFPVRVEQGDCRWLEIVERRINRSYVSAWGETVCFTERFYRAQGSRDNCGMKG